jgi:hypothetical protein
VKDAYADTSANYDPSYGSSSAIEAGVAVA